MSEAPAAAHAVATAGLSVFSAPPSALEASSPTSLPGEPDAPGGTSGRPDPRAPAAGGPAEAHRAPESEVDAPSPGSAAKSDEEDGAHEADGGDKQTFLVTLQQGEAEMVSGGTLTTRPTQLTLAVRHLTSTPARLRVRLRGVADPDAAWVAVTLNGEPVGEVAFDADRARQLLVLPAGLLTEGDNLVTLTRRAAPRPTTP